MNSFDACNNSVTESIISFNACNNGIRNIFKFSCDTFTSKTPWKKSREHITIVSINCSKGNNSYLQTKV